MGITDTHALTPTCSPSLWHQNRLLPTRSGELKRFNRKEPDPVTLPPILLVSTMTWNPANRIQTRNYGYEEKTGCSDLTGWLSVKISFSSPHIIWSTIAYK